MPKGFPWEASFDLTQEEASYMRNRVMQIGSGTALNYLLRFGQTFPDSQFPWQHPQRGELPTECAQHVEQAQNCSETIHGSFLVCNLMLAEQTNSEEQRSEFQDRLRD